MTEVMDVNDRIKEIRDLKKLRHADLSEITGYSPNTVKKWLTNSNSKHYQPAPIQALKILEKWLIDGDLIGNSIKTSRISKTYAEIWASMNHKGGTAKTTSTINFGLMLANQSNKNNPERKNKVLLVDADFQQNMTKSLITFPGDIKKSVSDIVIMAAKGQKYIYKKSDVNYGLPVDLLAATNNMSSDTAGIEPHELIYTLKEGIEWFKEHYDYILIDGLPSKGSWYVAVMAAADKVIIPFTPNKFDVWGVADVFEHVKKLRLRGINNNVKVAAVFCSEITKPYRVIDSVIIDEVKGKYPKEFCETLIRSSVKVKEGCDLAPPLAVNEYAPDTGVAEDYNKVLEFIKNS